jgi:GH24 family phage-related lysozyme (muramidase)
MDAGTLALCTTPGPGPMCVERSPPQWHSYSHPHGFTASMLTMSPEAVALLKDVEKLRLKPYDDQNGKDISTWVKGATIGYGHLIAQDEWALYEDGLIEQQADAMFRDDARPFERAVGQAIEVGVQQYEFDAMVILAFNIGQGSFRNPSVVKLINNPRAVTGHASLEDAWKSWNKSQGKVMKGLISRRAAEWRIYTSALYARW